MSKAVGKDTFCNQRGGSNTRRNNGRGERMGESVNIFCLQRQNPSSGGTSRFRVSRNFEYGGDLCFKNEVEKWPLMGKIDCRWSIWGDGFGGIIIFPGGGNGILERLKATGAKKGKKKKGGEKIFRGIDCWIKGLIQERREIFRAPRLGDPAGAYHKV